MASGIARIDCTGNNDRKTSEHAVCALIGQRLKKHCSSRLRLKMTCSSRLRLTEASWPIVAADEWMRCKVRGAAEWRVAFSPQLVGPHHSFTCNIAPHLHHLIDTCPNYTTLNTPLLQYQPTTLPTPLNHPTRLPTPTPTTTVTHSGRSPSTASLIPDPKICISASNADTTVMLRRRWSPPIPPWIDTLSRSVQLLDGGGTSCC